jgi:hypothetical protein
MILRKRTGNGKSTKHEVVEKLRVVAVNTVTRETTMSFTVGAFNGTEFLMTITKSEKDELIYDLTKDKE